MPDRPIFSYQTRPVLTPEQAAVLDAYADLYGRAERTLFAEMQAGRQSTNQLKQSFQPRFGINARQFNALRISLEGKIAAIKERRPELIAEAETRLVKARKVVERLAQKAAGSNKLHQKKRRLAILETRLKSLKADHDAGTVRLCFGSKKRFRAQFALKANGYADHQAWLNDWQNSRADQFFILGSQDEVAGNQNAQASINADGSLNLQLRLPEALSAHGKYLQLESLRFSYGQEQIVAALQSSCRSSATTKAGKPTTKRTGTALSYRFVRDSKGWRVFVSAEAPLVDQVSRKELGAFGVDINADQLAVSETDRFGNLITTQRYPLNTYGKTTDQAKALIGDAAVAILALAKGAAKPIVIERLNFQKKKAELETSDPRQARMLSSFACKKVVSSIKAAALRAGVEVIEVNPAFTSVIGAVNSAQIKGISVHQGAAYAIARRGLGLSEAPTVHTGIVPVRNGGHVTFALPARNRAKHVWSQWSVIRTKLKAAHAAHYRSGKAKTQPEPLRQSNPAACSIRSSPAKSRGANRVQHCSERVLEDVPW